MKNYGVKKYRLLLLHASTLAEMLIVMIITGIILMSVFEGFNLFQRLLMRVNDRLEKNISKMESFYKIDNLFSTSDSIVGDRNSLKLFNSVNGIVRITLEDSLLIVGVNDISDDTLFRHISSPRVIYNIENPALIDSLIFFNDSTKLVLSIEYKPNISAEWAARKLEIGYQDESDL